MSATSTHEGAGLFPAPGLRGAAVSCGVKGPDALDLALIVADQPRPAAAVFTTSRAAAAPVRLGRASLAQDPRLQAIVINSGNANALTGPEGSRHAAAMQATASALCGGPALVLSTGVIGVPLPIDDVLGGMERAHQALRPDPGDAVARAILTTDTGTKRCVVEVDGVRVGGVAKGSGMIHPNMATMLAVLSTDLSLPATVLDACLRKAVDQSFHAISVDGDTSTNDAVVLMGGARDLADPPPSRAVLDAFQRALDEATRTLARAIVLDGEGASRTFELEVAGAADQVSARRIGRAVCRSPLVKTALAGGDPNWGRLLAAAGVAGVDPEAQGVSLRLGEVPVFRDGAPCDYDEADAAAAFGRPAVQARLQVGDGPGQATLLTTDLTTRYVEINADYRS